MVDRQFSRPTYYHATDIEQYSLWRCHCQSIRKILFRHRIKSMVKLSRRCALRIASTLEVWGTAFPTEAEARQPYGIDKMPTDMLATHSRHEHRDATLKTTPHSGSITGRVKLNRCL